MYDVLYCICVICWCVKVVVTIRIMQAKESFKKTNQPKTN